MALPHGAVCWSAVVVVYPGHTYLPVWKRVSRTPDKEFHCFYSCEIFLSYIPVPSRGKDKTRGIGPWVAHLSTST